MTTQAAPNSPTPEPAMVEDANAERDAAWERVARKDEDAICQVPPYGWFCTRDAGHEGPCAAYPEPVGGEDETPLTDDDHARIDAAWESHRLAAIPTDRPIAGDGEGVRAARDHAYTNAAEVVQRYINTTGAEVVQHAVTDILALRSY